MIRSRLLRLVLCLTFAVVVADVTGVTATAWARDRGGAGKSGGDRSGGDRGGGDRGGGDRGGGDRSGGDRSGGDKGEGTGRSERNDDRAGRASLPAAPGRLDVSALADLSKDDAADARAALAAGRIRPLADILGVVRDTSAGRVLEVELRRGPWGSWTYEVTVIGRDGRYSEIEVDAGDARLRSVRRR